MAFALVSVLLLGTLGGLLLRGQLMAAGALLVAYLYADISDIGIRDHGWPSLAQPLVLLFAAIVFARGTRAGGSRSAGPIGDPNFYGLMLAAVVPLALMRFVDERRRILRAAALVAALLLVAGVGLTYSRGALIALVLSTAALVIVLRIPVRKVLAGGAVLLTLAAVSPSHYLQRVANIGQVDHSFAGHVGSQSVAAAMFADHPLIGVGADNYQA